VLPALGQVCHLGDQPRVQVVAEEVALVLAVRGENERAIAARPTGIGVRWLVVTPIPYGRSVRADAMVVIGTLKRDHSPSHRSFHAGFTPSTRSTFLCLEPPLDLLLPGNGRAHILGDLIVYQLTVLSVHPDTRICTPRP
jgi:hypothetical protein